MRKFYRIPGIAGFMGNREMSGADLISRFEELFVPLVTDPGERQSSFMVTPIGATGLLGRDLGQASDRGGAASNNLYSLLIDGEYFCSEGKRRHPTWLLEQISTSGIGMLDSLNGTYSFALHDKSRNVVILGGDRYSTRPLYYAVVEGTLLFTSDFRTLLQLMPSRDSINYDAMLDFINFEFVLCNETFHSLIKVLGHGERLEWNGKQLTSTRYWDYPDSLPSHPDARISDYAAETFHIMRNAVKRRIEGKTSVGVTLSSGLDSRFIAACIASIRNEPFPCYHLGKKGHKSSIWAAEICKRLNGIFRFESFNNLDVENLLESTFKILAGQYSLNQAEISWLLSSLDVKDTYILDGQLQDSLLQIQQFYPAESALRVRPRTYPEEILKFDCFTPDNLLEIVLKDAWLEKAISSRSERIARHFSGRIFKDTLALTRYFYFTARGQRYVWGSPVLESSMVDVGYPGMDYDLFDWGMRLPIELRGPEAPLYRNILCTYYPDVAAVPWDATGTPLNIFKGRRESDYSLIGKDLWVYIIRRMTWGRMDLSNNLHDQDKLFRKDPGFRKALLSPVGILDADIENPISKSGIETLTRMIKGGRNYIDLLRRLITVLNFFSFTLGKPTNNG